MSLILGSGIPEIRDGSLKIGSGDPNTRYRFKRKEGLFKCFRAQKILKCITELFSESIFSLGAFVHVLLSFG